MKKIFIKLNNLIASGLGSGYAPKAPGTFGSLAFLIIWFFLLRNYSLTTNIILCATVTTLGWISTALVLKFQPNLPKDKKGKVDPQWIVIDEWAGLYIALLFVDCFCFGQILQAFILFRIFDASKVPPVNYAERLPRSHGIMLDDLVAGLMAGGCIKLIQMI